jgi:catechol 2,3-dioxygenase-like lactoylglutathione lyase family enzyme
MNDDLGVPGMVGVEHFSTTVPDLAQALAFFTGVLGARLVRRTRFSAEPGSTVMVDRFNAHADALAELASLEIGGTIVELFEYEAPDLAAGSPRNCDPGGHHIGFRVEDVAIAADHLNRVPGVTVLGEPTYEERAGRRRGWLYFLSPWGMHLEIASETTLAES